METTQPETELQPEPVAEQPANWKRFVLDILETLVLAVVLYFGIISFYRFTSQNTLLLSDSIQFTRLSKLMSSKDEYN